MKREMLQKSGDSTEGSLSDQQPETPENFQPEPTGAELVQGEVDRPRLKNNAEERRPYPGYREAGTPKELASCLGKFDAKKQLFRGDIRRWVFDYFSSEMAEKIEQIEEEDARHPEVGLARLQYLMDPSLPLKIGKKLLRSVDDLLEELGADDKDTGLLLEQLFRSRVLDYWLSNHLTSETKGRVLREIARLREEETELSIGVLLFKIGRVIDPKHPLRVSAETVLRNSGDEKNWLARDPKATVRLGEFLADGRLVSWMEAFEDGSERINFIETLLKRHGVGEKAVLGTAWRLCPILPLVLDSGIVVRTPKELGKVWQGNPEHYKSIVNVIESGLLEIWLESVRFPGWEEDVEFLHRVLDSPKKADEPASDGEVGDSDTGLCAETTGKGRRDPVTGMEFVLVAGGTFPMGDLFGDGPQNERPVHTVTVDGFWLGKYPVTQGQWVKVMGNNPSNFRKGDGYPVERVSWNDVQEFIRKLNAKGDGKYRLPTEAEWEYAARSGGNKEKYAGGDDVGRLAWHDGVSGGSTHPVGKKAPNGLGLFDMSGNVWEWVSDWYGHGYYSESPAENPCGPKGGSFRVNRGGSWNDGPSMVRTTVRARDSVGLRSFSLGFRLARTFP